MPSKDKKVIGVKVSEYEYGQIERYANTHNMSISALIGICIRGLLNRDIEIEKGELKQGVNPNGYAVYDESEDEFKENLRYKELKFDKLLKVFEKNEYPDFYIRQSIEQIVGQINEGGRFKARRGSTDWGC